jgi:outer membrane usher protein FimD/PapC
MPTAVPSISPSRRSSTTAHGAARLLCTAILALSLAAAPALAADETLLLEVIVNGHDTGNVGTFTLRDGALFARPQELRELGLRVPDGAADPLALATLPGLTTLLDQAAQTPAVTAANDRLSPALLQAAPTPASAVEVESGIGATLNYDATSTILNRQASGAGSIDFRAFSPWGVLSSGMLAYAGASPNGPGTNAAIRLDSTYVYSDAVALRRYRLGDFINGGLAWTRPLRLGGVQINNLAVAGSGATGQGAAPRQSGMQVAAGAQRVGPVFSAAVSATVASSGFCDLAAMNGTPVARLQLDASAGLSLGRYGAFGVAYTGVDRSAAAAPIRVFAPPGTFLPETSVTGGTITTNGDISTFTPAQHVHLLTVSWSVQVRNVALYATGFHDFASAHSNGVLVGLTVPIGPRSAVSAGGGTAASGGGYGEASVQQTAIAPGDFGYRAYGSVGRPAHAFAQLDYKAPWALLSAGADRLDGESSGRAEAQGAVSFADGALFASNTINDSFAVVDTDGAPYIRVTEENRDAGRTNSAGKLLLPDLRAFDVNRIAIEPTDLPIDATVPTTAREVRPQDRSGVVVRFPVHASHGAVLRLVDAQGRPLPLGSAATLRATGATGAPVSVGYDGQAYVEGLGPHNTLAVEQPNGRRCTVAFDYAAAAGDIPVLGPLSCREAPP